MLLEDLLKVLLPIQEVCLKIGFKPVHLSSVCTEAHLSGINYFSVHMIFSTPPNIPISSVGRNYVNNGVFEIFLLYCD